MEAEKQKEVQRRLCEWAEASKSYTTADKEASLRELLEDPDVGSALRDNLQQIGNRGGQSRMLRFGPTINHADDPQVMRLRHLFLNECARVQRTLFDDLRALYSLYASIRERKAIDEAAAGEAVVERDSPGPSAAELKRRLHECLSARKLNVEWIRDAILFSCDLWYPANPGSPNARVSEIFVPPTFRLREDERYSANTWRMPGDSYRDVVERLRQSTREECERVKQEARADREFKESEIALGVQYLARTLGGTSRELEQVAESEDISLRTVAKYRRRAAEIIGYPLTSPRRGRPKKAAVIAKRPPGKLPER